LRKKKSTPQTEEKFEDKTGFGPEALEEELFFSADNQADEEPAEDEAETAPPAEDPLDKQLIADLEALGEEKQPAKAKAKKSDNSNYEEAAKEPTEESEADLFSKDDGKPFAQDADEFNPSPEPSEETGGTLFPEDEETGTSFPPRPEIETPPAPELPHAWDQEVDSTPEIVFRQEIPRKSWSKYYWGLDVGSHTIKLVGIQKSFNTLKLIHVCMVEISPQKELQRNAQNSEVISTAILKTLEGLDLERNSIVSAVENSAAVIRQIQYPAGARQKLLSALHWETRRYIPFKPDEVVVDAQILDEEEKSGKIAVLLTAVPKEHLDTHLKLLDRAGVKPLTVDAGQLATINTFLYRNILQQGETIVFLDMGANATYLTIYGDNGPFFTLSLSVGGSRFTREIQSRCQLSYAEAESLKCKGKGNQDQYYDNDTYYPLHEALQNTYELLISEIRQSLVYYNKQTGINKFDRVVLTGGGSALPEFPDYLARKLGISVQLSDPLKNLEFAGKNFDIEQIKKIAPQLTLAMGLALRGVA
jgi:type IV pilus assembly protein PilM